MKIVLAYSGGLDTSVILKWLGETYQAEVIALCLDLGQDEETRGLKQKAMRTGASKCFLVDAVDEFAADFVYPMMQAGAIYEGQYLLGTSIARPLIAKVQVDVAHKERAQAVLTEVARALRPVRLLLCPDQGREDDGADHGQQQDEHEHQRHHGDDQAPRRTLRRDLGPAVRAELDAFPGLGIDRYLTFGAGAQALHGPKANGSELPAGRVES